jgi:hemerythrin-like domain-containing protein/uncharacterized protein (DUF2249 family)
MTNRPETPPTFRGTHGRAGGWDDTHAELTWENEGGRLRSSGRSSEPPPARSRESDPPGHLAEEHALLLRNVVARADDVLATIAGDRWPRHELVELVDYLRTEVISQARMEEQLLFADADNSAGETFRGLTRDHVALRFALEALTDAARGDGGHRDLESLAATVRRLVTTLAQHLRQEQDVLLRHASDTGWQLAQTAMEQRPHAWYPLIHAPVIDLDALSPGQVVEAVRPRVRQLRPDEQIELVSGSDLQRLCNHLLHDGDVAVHHLCDGPRTWRVSVRRRPAE